MTERSFAALASTLSVNKVLQNVQLTYSKFWHFAPNESDESKTLKLRGHALLNETISTNTTLQTCNVSLPTQPWHVISHSKYRATDDDDSGEDDGDEDEDVGYGEVDMDAADAATSLDDCSVITLLPMARRLAKHRAQVSIVSMSCLFCCVFV
jgi:hypothetical protein